MTRSNPGRRAERTLFSAYSWVIVAVTAAVAAGSLFFTDLAPRVAGVSLAVAGGVIGCLLAWRETAKARALAAAESASYLRWSVAKLHEERTQHNQVLDVLDERRSALRAQVKGLLAETAELHREVSSLRGNNESLRIELAMVRSLEAEAEVLAMPRRATGVVDRLAAADLWDHADSPTVVDLQRIAAPYVDEAVRNLA